MASHLPRPNAWTVAAVFAAVALTAASASVVHRRTADGGAGATTLVASLRAEPRSFNRYVARDLSTTVLTLLMHDSLVRINRRTNELEPALAERWERLADGRSYRLHLRDGVRFSDGVPFSADDVVFSFRAIYDAGVDSVLADSLEVRGKPLAVTAENRTTIVIRFPSAFEPGLRVLDGVPIFPRHRLEQTLKANAFRTAWSTSTTPSEIVGLGPFVLREYVPGERLTFDRNPHYWRSVPPRLEHVVLQVVPDQDSELLQLESGGIDMTQSELRPSDGTALRRAESHVTITDAGIALDGDLLWMNLGPSRARDPRARWLQAREFRHAIAHSVDRQAFADTVYLGAALPADSIVSPGNVEWHVVAPMAPHDVVAAESLLASLGLSRGTDHNTLHDAKGRDVRFTLITQKGNTSLERGAAIIRESLERLGVHVDVVPLEVGALIARVMQGDYDAAYFRLLTTDADPALNLDFWLSSGSAHMWNPGQPTAATPWEASIDRLMEEVTTSNRRDRRLAAFAEVQRIMARELPALCFAFPRVAVAVGSRVSGASPAPFRPPVLWAPERLGIQSAH